ncbi:hypothetical protein D3C87_1417580 [compost metagenome]
MSSAMAPKLTQKPSSNPNGTSEMDTPPSAEMRMVRKMASAARPISRCPAATRSARFHANRGPKGSTSRSGAISAPKVRLKNGAPTEIVVPAIASSSSG